MASPKLKIVSVSIADLKTNLFVRNSLNQDHALYLAELIQNGTELPPIKITADNVVVDGRHRIEAHALNNRKCIDAEVVAIDDADEISLISAAYRANVGGALPSTNADTEHTIAALLERGEKKTRIGELLGMPPAMARKYVSAVQSRLNRAKVMRAAAAVTDGGLTVAKAAEQYGADVALLKEVLSGNRRKHKQGVQDLKRTLSRQYSSVSQKNASMLRKLTDQYGDGDVSSKQVFDIFTQLEKLQKQSTGAVAEWKKRFVALTKTEPATKSA